MSTTFKGMPSLARSLVFFARTVARYGSPRALLTFTGGLGDHLLCTTVAREMRRRGQPGLWMMSNHGELFERNPDIDVVVPVSGHLARLARIAGARVIAPHYATYDAEEDRDIVPENQHIIATMCGLAGLRDEVELRPYLILSEDERRHGQRARRQIAIQSSGLAARYPMRNKEWFPERMQAVVDALSGTYTFIQLGDTSDPSLAGVLDMRGRASMRETAAILSQSLAFVGLVGFLMHLARAVDCRSVIVYGGREHPSQSGYSCNENLFSPLACAPCWKKNDCPFNRRCMREITPDAVINAIERAVVQAGDPLAVDRVVVKNASREPWNALGVPNAES